MGGTDRQTNAFMQARMPKGVALPLLYFDMHSKVVGATCQWCSCVRLLQVPSP
jgi:hypothetical protein